MINILDPFFFSNGTNVKEDKEFFLSQKANLIKRERKEGLFTWFVVSRFLSFHICRLLKFLF